MSSIYDMQSLSKTDAALKWFRYGFKVIPIAKKTTTEKWDKWLSDLSETKITDHWNNNPNHDIGAIVDSAYFILDGDTEESIAHIHELEKAFDIKPNLIQKTANGVHHFFKRSNNTYAKQCSYSTDKHPLKIDVKTGRSTTKGRSMIVLTPSAGKEIALCEADSSADLIDVEQDFIDAVFKHNNEDPPRELSKAAHTELVSIASESEVGEIVSWIDPSLDYSDWISVGMGLYDKFQGSETGFNIWNNWSSKGNNYDADEMEYKWTSFSNGTGTTFGTVCHLAEESGANLQNIKSSYDANGNKRKSYDNLKKKADSFNTDTEPKDLEELIRESKHLTPIETDKINQAIKQKTKTLLSTIKAISNEKIDDLELAKELVNEVEQDNVMFTQGFFWRWNESGLWKKYEDRQTKKLVQDSISSKIDAIRKSRVDSVNDLFKTEIYRNNHIFNVGNPECVNCINGELILNSDNTWKLAPHKREHYRTAQIPIIFDKDATSPRFYSFMDEVFEDDSDSDDKIKAILEMIGYSLMAHCHHEKFIMLIGSGANGKSVLLSVIEALCGRNNTAGVQPSQFENKFQRAYLDGKLVNVVSEIKQGAVIDDSALKAIVSGETTTVENKGQDPFNMSPFTTCWFGTNHMPHTKDFTDGLFRRALIIKFNNRFSPERGNADPKLKTKLLDELSGILNAALSAYAEAIENGFTTPDSCKEANNEWRLEADPIAQFVESVCERDVLEKVQPTDLFDAYLDWTQSYGIKNTVSLRSFRNRLTALGFGNSRDNKSRYVTGIKLINQRSHSNNHYRDR